MQTDSQPAEQHIVQLTDVAEYVPGEFYRRELPCLLQALLPVLDRVQTILIDGYVDLAPNRPGLGARLYEALGGKIAVVGVAKTAFAGAHHACEVLRGESERPLYITAAGMTLDDAATGVRSMHGPHRIPTLLRLVDQLARGIAAGPDHGS